MACRHRSPPLPFFLSLPSQPVACASPPLSVSRAHDLAFLFLQAEFVRGGHVSAALSAKAVDGAAEESVSIVTEAARGGSLRAPTRAQGGADADTEVSPPEYVEAARQARAHIHAVRSFVQEAKGRYHARP